MVVITLAIGAVTYISEFTEGSIRQSIPLQTMYGFTNPIRNTLGLYGFFGFLFLLLIGILFVLWLDFKEEKEIEEYNKKQSNQK